MNNIIFKNCLRCDNLFLKKSTVTNSKWKKIKYCSKECYYKLKKSEETRKKMGWEKGKKRELHTEEWKENLSNMMKGKVRGPYKEISEEGLKNVREAGKRKRGENSCNWKGGITPINLQIRNSLEYKLWREAVFKRDEYTCIWCGDKKGGNLNADHIKPFSLFPELRFAIDNGRTLCISCHKKTETYGRKVFNYKNNS